MVNIEDEIHCGLLSPFGMFENATHRAALQNCNRMDFTAQSRSVFAQEIVRTEYRIIEYDERLEAARLPRQVHVLGVFAKVTI